MRTPCTLALMMMAAASAQETGKLVIAGRIVLGASDKPLAFARVMLDRANSRPAQPLQWVKTGADGAFSFTVDRPGMYSLTAQYRGMMRPYGHGGAVTGFGVGVMVGPDQDTSHLTFRWPAAAAIQGRVVDAATGEPKGNALIQTVHAGVVDGRRRLIRVSSRYSDERGYFRVPHLPSGKFFLIVTAKYELSGGVSNVTTPGHTSSTLAYSPVYYPSRPSTAPDAQGIMLQSGAEEEVNVALSLAPGADVTVRGKVPDASTGSGRLEIVSADLPEIETSQSFEWFYRDMTLPGIPAGNYIARLRKDRRILAERAFHAAGTPVEVQLDPPAPVTLTGTVKFNGSALPKRSVSVVFREVNNLHVFSAPVKIGADGGGKIETNELWPGRYWIREVSGEGFAVEPGIAATGAPLSSGNILTVAEGANITLGLSMSNARGSVSGFAVDTADKPRAGMLVVAYHMFRKPEEGFAFAFQTDSDGSFDFRSVPEGEYSIVAVANQDFAFREASVIAGALSSGMKVRVRAGQPIRNQRVPVQ